MLIFVPGIDPTHQTVILARLSEYCRYGGAVSRYESDPWEYMRSKLLDTQEAFRSLKHELYAATSGKLIEEMLSGPLSQERCSDFGFLFEKLLAPGDFADVAVHLTPAAADHARGLAALKGLLPGLKPHTPFLQESKPAAERSPSWEKLIAELYRRLDFERLGAVLKRKPGARRRKAYVLRRVRRNVDEYCSVLRVPKDPRDTFTPFILGRIEALVAANLRFLNQHR